MACIVVCVNRGNPAVQIPDKSKATQSTPFFGLYGENDVGLKAKSAIFQSPYAHITLATPVNTELQDTTEESSKWQILVDIVQNGGTGAILATPTLITGMMEEEIFDDPDFRADYEHQEGIDDELSQDEIDTITQPTMELQDI